MFYIYIYIIIIMYKPFMSIVAFYKISKSILQFLSRLTSDSTTFKVAVSHFVFLPMWSPSCCTTIVCICKWAIWVKCALVWCSCFTLAFHLWTLAMNTMMYTESVMKISSHISFNVPSMTTIGSVACHKNIGLSISLSLHPSRETNHSDSSPISE